MKLKIPYLFLQEETISLTPPPPPLTLPCDTYVCDIGGPRYIPMASYPYVTLDHQKLF